MKECLLTKKIQTGSNFATKSKEEKYHLEITHLRLTTSRFVATKV